MPAGKGGFFLAGIPLAICKEAIMPNPKVRLVYDPSCDLFSFTKFPSKKKVRLGISRTTFKTIEEASKAAKQYGLRLDAKDTLVS